MKMHNPPHPGEVIKEAFLQNSGLSNRQVSKYLDVSHSTVNKLLKGEISISVKMALRLSKSIGLSAETWLRMQVAYDLWHAEKHIDLKKVKRLPFIEEHEKKHKI